MCVASVWRGVAMTVQRQMLRLLVVARATTGVGVVLVPPPI